MLTQEAQAERDARDKRLAEIATDDFLEKLEEAVALVGWSLDMTETNQLHSILCEARGLTGKYIAPK